MSQGKIKEYSNGEITVIWEASKCIHSGVCVRTLPNVYDPQGRPWIKVENATTEELKNQIDQCPSGALSYKIVGEEERQTNFEIKAQIMKDGPLLIHGNIAVHHPDGKKESKDKTTAFCRCGNSKNKPYCDGSHQQSEFKG